MTPEDTTVVLVIPIPSTSPVFLTVVGLHFLVGLVCVVAGAIAMLSPKRMGRHPMFGTIYYWALVFVFVSASHRLSSTPWHDPAYRRLIFSSATMCFDSVCSVSRGSENGSKSGLK